MAIRPKLGKNIDQTESSSDVLNVNLTGFVVGTNIPIDNTDTILTAFQKTQAQLNAISVAEVTSVTGTSNRITTSPTIGNVVVDISASYVGQSSITTLGTIGTGTWQSSLIVGQYGGTGVNNTGKTITLGGSLTTSGAFTTTFIVTGNTNVTLPTSGTLVGGTGVTNQVSYWNGTNNQAGSTGFLYDPTNVLLGIGGTTPAARLHLSGNISAPAWTTNGIGIRDQATTYTDTTSATGTVPVIYGNYFGVKTFNSTNASVVVTNLYGNFFETPLVTGNLTATSVYSAGFSGNIIVAGSLLSNASGTSSIGHINAQSFQILTAQTARVIYNNSGLQSHSSSALSSGTTPFITFTQVAHTGGAQPGLLWTAGAHTGQTASTEVVDQNWVNTGTISYLTGNLATQRAVRFQGRNYSFGGASTITDLINVDFETPTIGTNGTATNVYAARFQGDLAFTGGNRKFNFSNNLTITTAGQSPFTVQQTATSSGTNALFRLLQASNTGGSQPIFSISSASITGQTSSTEINDVLFDLSASKQWATGAISIQRDFYIKARTYAFASASTITDAYNVYIEKPVVGTNATITNNFALGLTGSAVNLGGGWFTRSGSQGNFGTLDAQTAGMITNNTTRTSWSGTGYQMHTCGSSGAPSTFITYTQAANSGGSGAGFLWTAGAHTSQTASTEIIDINYNLTRIITWAAGAITTQRSVVIGGPTYAFASASTITTGITLDITAPIAGTNATITNNFAIRSSGNLCLSTIGNGLYIKEGSNATMGTGTLSAGTLVISNTKVTANSRIFLTDTGGGVLANIGALYISARSAGTSFTVSSSNALDTSTFSWIIIEPAP